MLHFVLSKVWGWVLAAVGVVAGFLYIKNMGVREQKEKQQKADMKDYINTRKSIDEVRTPDNADAAYEWLRQRDERRK
jgi:hypothetical protein